MSSIDPKILSKIRKCLSLAASDNPNEAAAALRQARALMEKYGVSSESLTLADIGEGDSAIQTMSRDKPARWEGQLVSLVARAFGCKLMISRFTQKGRRHLNDGSWSFVGLRHQAEVAAYTASVLTRKCKASRAKWLAENFAGMSRGQKGVKAKLTALGDVFAEGWVMGIEKLVVDFAVSQEVGDAIHQYITKQVGGDRPDNSHDMVRSAAAKSPDRVKAAALALGAQASKGESLHRPVRGKEAASLPLFD